MILTPDKMRHAMGKNPWEVLEDISPVNLARPHYDPDKVPIIFEHQGVRYLGWLKRGLLPVVFDCQFEDLPLNVPQREIITPPPIISTSNNEEQRLQQLRNQTAELERQRKLAEQRRENQIKTREEQKQLQAQIDEEQAKQYLLQHGELSAWNPLDWWRLLVWALWSPDKLKRYREIFGQESERYVGSWLASTLVWLPLFLVILAPALALVPLSLKLEAVQNAIAVVTIAWFLAGIFGHINDENAGVVAFFVSVAVSVAVAGGVAVVVAGVVAFFVSGGVASVVASVVAFFVVAIVAFSIEDNFKKSFETGKPFYFNRFLLILLIAGYAFLIWYFYLKGWQYFN